MAGNYPDAPSRRLAWDADGTQGFQAHYAAYSGYTPPTPPAVPDLAHTLMSATTRQNLNGEDNTVGITWLFDVSYLGNGAVILLFPDQRDIDGWYWNMIGRFDWGVEYIYYSTDTTSGFDGTWTSLAGSYSEAEQVLLDFRDGIQTATTPTGVKGIRFGMNVTSANITVKDTIVRAMHFYGVPSSGANADRLIFLDTGNSDAEYTLPIDDGDVGRGADTGPFNLKIKNNSSTKQANTVAITATGIVNDSHLWYTFATTSGGTYSSTLALGNLAASASTTVYWKKNVPDAETLGLHVCRFEASKASWT